MNREPEARKAAIRDYILRRLTEEEELEIETAMTLDAGLRLDYEEGILELERDYTRHQLNADDTARFERYCLPDPGHQASMQLSAELDDLATRHGERLSGPVRETAPKESEAPGAGFLESLRSWLGPLWQPLPLAVAAAVLIAVAANVLVLTRLDRAGSNLAAAKAREQQARDQLLAMDRTIRDLRSEVQDYPRTLALAIPGDRVFVSRGAPDQTPIRVPSTLHYGSISLLVPVGRAGQEVYPSYRLSIVADGRELWSSAASPATAVAGSYCVVAVVPASLFRFDPARKPARIVAVVDGLNQAGERKVHGEIPLELAAPKP